MKKDIAKVGAALFGVICTAQAAEPTPFTTTFDVRFAGLGAATALVQLERDGDRLLYRSTITPQGLLATLFSGTLHSTAQMRYEDGRIVAEEYATTHARNTDKDQRYRFEAHGRSVEVLKKGRVYFMAVPAGTLDEASVQLQLIQDAQTRAGAWHYTLVSNGKLKRYRFTKTGTETIATALGEVEAVRVERARLREGRDDGTDHRYWLSTMHRYLPVRVERLKNGKIERTMTVKTISLER